MKSTATRVVFNEPVVVEIASPTPAERGANMDYAAITAMCTEARKKGFGDNAIVVRRNIQIHEMRQAHQWGVVKDLRSYRMAGGSSYIPLLVSWLKDNTQTQEWPDDLLVVHPGLDWQVMDARMKAQL